MAIIGLSAESNSNISAQFLKVGANDFISKPYSYEELICRVTQNLEMLELFESIRNIANHDYLTGMYNRRFFFAEGGDIYAHAKANNVPLLAAMVDVDHFKKVNDSYSHDCGDVVLKRIAEQLKAHSHQDLVARMGGEEFAILMTGDERSSRERLEAFRKHMEQEVIQYNKLNIQVTASIGGTTDFGGNLDTMLGKADENLYAAKQNGRNQVVV